LIQSLFELPSTDYGIAYIYFEHQQAQGQKSSEYIASILRQLEQRTATITPSVRDAYNASKSQKPDLEKLKSLLIDSSKSFKVRTFIVLDAFDECTVDGRQQLIDTLESVLPRNNQFSVFISSRPNRSLDDFALSFSAQTKTINIVAGEGAQSDDMRAYINHKLAKERIDTHEKLIISQGIEEKAKGLYCSFISFCLLIHVDFSLLGCT
jgi:hypothetical protein